jgi:hypothetical protein
VVVHPPINRIESFGLLYATQNFCLVVAQLIAVFVWVSVVQGVFETLNGVFDLAISSRVI